MNTNFSIFVNDKEWIDITLLINAMNIELPKDSDDDEVFYQWCIRVIVGKLSELIKSTNSTKFKAKKENVEFLFSTDPICIIKEITSEIIDANLPKAVKALALGADNNTIKLIAKANILHENNTIILPGEKIDTRNWCRKGYGLSAEWGRWNGYWIVGPGEWLVRNIERTSRGDKDFRTKWLVQHITVDKKNWTIAFNLGTKLVIPTKKKKVKETK